MTRKRVISLACAVLVVGACEQPTQLEPTYQGLPSPNLPANATPVSMVETGNRLMNAGETELALKAYSHALAHDEVSVDALLGLGTANHRLGRLNQAEKFFEAALEKEPDRIMAWNNLGVVRYMRGKQLSAREAFRTAFALSGGKSDSIRHNLALVEDQTESSVDLSSIVPEFRLIRSGYGRYRLNSYKVEEKKTED